MSRVRLYMFSGSNAVLTAQLMLAHKRLAHTRVNLPPAVHAFALRALGFPAMTVPALAADGRRVQGTREISRWLDEVVPERPLFPADPTARAEVEEAERWGETFQDAIRRLVYCLVRRDSSGYVAVVCAGRTPPMRVALRTATPLIAFLASTVHSAGDEAGRRDAAALPAFLDHVDALIAAGVIGGVELNAADFQIAPNVAALLLSADTAPYVEGRPAAALAERVAPGYTGRVGHWFGPGTFPPVLPDGWLPPLSRT